MRLRNHSQLLQLGDSVGLRTKVASKWSFALDQSRVDTPFFPRPKSHRPNPGKRGTLFTSTQTSGEDGVLQAGSAKWLKRRQPPLPQRRVPCVGCGWSNPNLTTSTIRVPVGSSSTCSVGYTSRLAQAPWVLATSAAPNH